MKENTIEIILVEDNPAHVEMTLDALKERNLANKVRVLKDGAEALDYILNNIDCRPGRGGRVLPEDDPPRLEASEGGWAGGIKEDPL